MLLLDSTPRVFPIPANGTSALYNNTTGGNNTATGYGALYSNTAGRENTANGYFALYNNKGSYNTATGYYALAFNTTGNFNTAFGYSAGSSSVTGNNNTFIGYNARGIETEFDLNNVTAIGAGAIVSISNSVRIGNGSVTLIEGQVAWSYPSDRRLKENIVVNNRLGLNFITQLQPVSYNYISDKTKVRHEGFIAQDIEKVMNDLNLPFSGLKKSGDGMYSLAYSDFVMPLVNAVKEQQSQIEELKKENEVLKALVKRVAALEEKNNQNRLRASAKK